MHDENELDIFTQNDFGKKLWNMNDVSIGTCTNKEENDFHIFNQSFKMMIIKIGKMLWHKRTEERLKSGKKHRLWKKIFAELKKEKLSERERERKLNGTWNKWKEEIE